MPETIHSGHGENTCVSSIVEWDIKTQLPVEYRRMAKAYVRSEVGSQKLILTLARVYGL